MSFSKNLKRVAEAAMGLDADDVLDMVGLTRKRTALEVVLPAIGLVAAGVAVGAGIGIFFAPTSGRQLRQQAQGKVDELREKVREQTNDIASQVSHSQTSP